MNATLEQEILEVVCECCNCSECPPLHSRRDCKEQAAKLQALFSRHLSAVIARVEGTVTVYIPEGHDRFACFNHERYTSACCGCQCQRASEYALDNVRQELAEMKKEVLGE